jgi:hypothetical protein
MVNYDTHEHRLGNCCSWEGGKPLFKLNVRRSNENTAFQNK